MYLKLSYFLNVEEYMSKTLLLYSSTPIVKHSVQDSLVIYRRQKRNEDIRTFLEVFFIMKILYKLPIQNIRPCILFNNNDILFTIFVL